MIFCGLGINNTMMYNQVKKTWAKQSVALDVSKLIVPVFFFSLSIIQLQILLHEILPSNLLLFQFWDYLMRSFKSVCLMSDRFYSFDNHFFHRLVTLKKKWLSQVFMVLPK